MPHVICEPCIGVKDRACMDVCPTNCIYEGDRDDFPDMLFIRPDECIDCRLCIPECPVQAIFIDDEVPEEWTHYIELNRAFFARAG